MMFGKSISIYNITFSSNIIEKDNYILSCFFECSEGDELESFRWRYNVSYKVLDTETKEFDSLFSINRNGSYYLNKKENIYTRCWIKINQNTFVNDKDNLDVILSNFKKEDCTSDGDFFNVKDPILFCTIPFLEDDVKNWIMSYGLVSLNFEDIKSMIMDRIKII